MVEEYNCYEHLVEDIEDKIVPRLNEIIEKLRIADEELKKRFQFDDESIDYKKIHNLREKIIGYRDFLEHTCRDRAQENVDRLHDELLRTTGRLN